ncbi:hypothetical protein MBM_07658 [Drepanopeziza brunnea f. sp. 'multigermtubi' MB_m1]|uniref:Uncharacterized protein n=1 Tax=Marssonina brunnea f. sp. multigermtubi (strain MB_m1) TaxID=1072389 RepID=K1WM66_MARBU|nr:uncharacterized protein MBM_07658 [Drepanopeziza brunnea f. sp. 'multigermtubi' MB_m1]EKD13981.1 hypothetical protein MBM_07658 [Drepanopeziza brunnea f. sp. 'multigermtubi' MB_m1]
MRSFDNSFSSAPVLTFHARHPHRSPFNSMRPFSNSGFSSSGAPSWPNLDSTQLTSPPAAGRKRSRAEAAPNLEGDNVAPPPPVLEAAPENEEDWEYGEGMTIIKKGGKEYVADSTSQTQDWAEERAAEEKAKAAAAMAAAIANRPAIRATKSMRLNSSATPAIPEEPTSTDGVTVAPGSPERHITPAVDDFTRHLGIGWSAVNNSSPDVQAAARGWAKFIENHFPVTNATIRLTSKGLASYLVEANEGYFLFAEDLKQGRLVSTSLDQTWVNLGSPVPKFDSDLVMEAGHTPKESSQPMVDETRMTDDNKMVAQTTLPLPAVGTANGINASIVDGHVMQEALVNETATTDVKDATRLPAQSLEVEMDMS